MYCVNCGRELSQEVSFCPFCGTKQMMQGSSGVPTEERTIYLRRGGELKGSAVPFDVYLDDELLTIINSGDSFAFETDYSEHTLFALGQDPVFGIRKKAIEKAKKNQIIIPAGEKTLTYVLKASFSGVRIELFQ